MSVGNESLNSDDIEFGVVVGKDKNGKPFVFVLGDADETKVVWCERLLSKAVEKEFDAIFQPMVAEDEGPDDDDEDD